MKKLQLLIITSFLSCTTIAQVAINSNGSTPHPSAMLDVRSNSKGILIPQVFLNSSIDATTILTPAPTLLVWNTNNGFASGAGFYFNKGTTISPNWQPLQDLVLPYEKSTSDAGPAFSITNYSQISNSSAIRAQAGGGGLALEVDGRMRISGAGLAPGVGKVLTSDAAGNASWQGAIAFSAVGVKDGGSLSVAHMVAKKVPFGEEVYDLGNNYIDANTSPHSTFTAPVKGIYHFDAHLSWSNGSADGVFTITLMRVRNGGTTPLAAHDITDTKWAENTCSTDVLLEAGDQVYVEAHHSHGSTVNMVAASKTAHFNGRLVIKL